MQVVVIGTVPLLGEQLSQVALCDTVTSTGDVAAIRMSWAGGFEPPAWAENVRADGVRDSIFPIAVRVTATVRGEFVTSAGSLDIVMVSV